MGGISKVVLHLCEEQQKDHELQISVYCAKGKSALFESFEKKGISIFATVCIAYSNPLFLWSSDIVPIHKSLSVVSVEV